ncbi:MAG: transcriptional regulator [Spirochaetes bacterium]|nr:transcriptional regulator [Spirochaetota bacterium]
MFKVKASVVYPVHGVGVIKKIEKKEILGEVNKYYIIEFINNNIKIMIPTDKAEEMGIRPVIKKSEAQKILKILKSKPSNLDDDWKSRYQNNTERIKTGSIHEIASVVRDLYKRNKLKELSLMERKMYESAVNHLVLEIATAKKISHENAEKIINKILP